MALQPDSASDATLSAALSTEKKAQLEHGQGQGTNGTTRQQDNLADTLPIDEKAKADRDYEVRWEGVNDPGNPKGFSIANKWIYTCVVSMGSLCVFVLKPPSTLISKEANS